MTDGEQHAGRTRRRRRRGGVSLATRLAASVLALSLVALAVATFVGLNAGVGLGREISEQRLRTLSDAGSFDVAAQLGGLRSANEALALSPEASTAVADFSEAFDRLSSAVTTGANELTRDLLAAYDEVYLDRDTRSSRPPAIGELVPSDARALYLQRRYSVEAVDVETGQPVVGEPEEGQTVEIRRVEEPGRLDDAGDGSDWSAVHARFHPVYRRVVDELELLDLYLIEPTDSRIVYSVEKRPDLGTSLVGGPFGGTVLATTVDAVIDDPGGGARTSDLRSYPAAPGRTVGVIATPIVDDGELAGVVALMYDGGDLSAILDPTAITDDSEFSRSADVYLVGADGTLRSDPSSFLSDPVAYLDASEAAGQITASERAAIEAAGSTVLVQRAAAATVLAGVAGDDSVERRTSVSGADVFTVVTPLTADDVEWYVVAEVGFDEAEAALTDFANILIVGTSLFVIAVAFFAVAWATRIVAPVRTISDRLGSGDVTNDELVIPEQSPVEMHQLAESFRSMAATLDAQQVSLALAREERLELMRRMLPDAVATRIVSGALDGIDEVSNASVAVVVVLGLGDLVRRDPDTQHDIVDRLHGELDDLADVHGLDRVKVVGDAYFAACGHDRPFIDHAPRAAAFASEAGDAVRAIGREVAAGLDVAAGIHTGPVSVGMTGGARLVYDVWGPTVTTAHHLARRARTGDVIVSDTTRAMLPDDVECVRVDSGDADIWRITTAITPNPAGTVR
jgi:class 3 adenylate cyclase